jgi:hypothetical protein
MGCGPFLSEKADGSLVDGWTDVAEEGRAMWLTLEEKVTVVDCPAETPV